MITKIIREEALKELRESVKKSGYSYKDIAGKIHVSSGWIGSVLRGNFPGYKEYYLPHNIYFALKQYGFDVPKILKFNYVSSHSPETSPPSPPAPGIPSDTP